MNLSSPATVHFNVACSISFLRLYAALIFVGYVSAWYLWCTSRCMKGIHTLNAYMKRVLNVVLVPCPASVTDSGCHWGISFHKWTCECIISLIYWTEFYEKENGWVNKYTLVSPLKVRGLKHLLGMQCRRNGLKFRKEMTQAGARTGQTFNALTINLSNLLDYIAKLNHLVKNY